MKKEKKVETQEPPKQKELPQDLESDHHGKYHIDYGRPNQNRTHIVSFFVINSIELGFH